MVVVEVLTDVVVGCTVVVVAFMEDVVDIIDVVVKLEFVVACSILEYSEYVFFTLFT